MNLALFDFDGTISSKNSLADFIIYAIGHYRYYSGIILLSPVLLAWQIKIISAEQAKMKLLEYFFKDWQLSVFKETAHQYSTEKLTHIIRPKALQKIVWHQAQGDTVVVVSASLKCWLQGWCEQQNIQLIATEWAIGQSSLIAKTHSENCQGEEKARRIRAAYDLEKFEHIYAYGDSSGDKEMLALADEVHYRPFRHE